MRFNSYLIFTKGNYFGDDKICFLCHENRWHINCLLYNLFVLLNKKKRHSEPMTRVPLDPANLMSPPPDVISTILWIQNAKTKKCSLKTAAYFRRGDSGYAGWIDTEVPSQKGWIWKCHSCRSFMFYPSSDTVVRSWSELFLSSTLSAMQHCRYSSHTCIYVPSHPVWR